MLDGKPVPENPIRAVWREAVAARDSTYQAGISPKVVQTMLGHSSISVTLDVYSHVSLELAKQAAAKLNAALTGGT